MGKIERALISVSDKQGIVEFSRRFVIPAQAGIQVCSPPNSLDTRFRGYDGTPGSVRFAELAVICIFKGGTKDTKGSDKLNFVVQKTKST